MRITITGATEMLGPKLTGSLSAYAEADFDNIICVYLEDDCNPQRTS
ncbi:MAG: hypothetical protein ACI8UP_003864 [Porticoccaceae bacterium]|jgi:hypothetical protein